MSVMLGPFQLEARIGVGGGGEVWRGRHRTQGVPVALKLITGERANDGLYREAFRREVQAVAGLGHPGVVQVLDTGTVDGAAAEASKGRLVEGSPFLAMELAQGSLRDREPPDSFEVLRLWLLWLLDILAEAHAQGVVHRDLKPGNVLWFEEPAILGDVDGASRLRLADFGLAHAMFGDDVSRGTAGTPTYMAPEQFRGRWRDFGPATDLYAIGCMAYAFASGRPPFLSADVTELMHAHLSRPPPALAARFPVPEGFEAWLCRAMQKAPHHRFQRAADAATALQQLGTVEGIRPAPRPPVIGRETLTVGTVTATISSSATGFDSRTERTLKLVESATIVPEERLVGDVVLRTLPPLPSRPRALPRRPSLPLLGAGLGLYGLRAVPLVGREAEADAIWKELVEVRRSRSARAVVLRGPAGTGKSRLAEWVAVRAHAAGGAFVAKASHDPGAGPTHGIVRLLTATTGAAGLSDEALVARLAEWAGPRGVEGVDVRAIVELLGASGESAPTAAERLALTLRVLERAAAAELDDEPRPLLLWLDDVQWGEDTLDLVGAALDLQLPALFVLTVQEDALNSRPVEAARLEALQELPAVNTLQIGPLSPAARGVLVQELLMLEGELAAQVEQRTQGIPLFAVQLVGDWVRRGMLAIGRRGFVLRKGVTPDIPDGIHELWAQRVERSLQDGREALELAAVLGTTVDRAEWRAAARVAGLQLDPSAVEGLVGHGLATASPESFTFVHGMLRESLERSARDGGRFEQLHQAAANALQIRWEAQHTRGLAERVGRHFLLAGRGQLALEPLLEAARERRALSDYEGALAVLDRRARAMDRLGVAPQDPRRGQEWVARADVLICLGRLEEAEAEANKVVRVGRQKHWESLIAPALRHAAVAVGKRGQLVAAARRLSRAVEAARYGGDDLERARCVLFQGDVARMQGAHEVAVGHYRTALRRFRANDDVRGEGLALLGLSGVHAVMDQVDQAERFCLAAIACFERRGARFAVASANNALGDLRRQQRRYGDAEKAYVEAERGMIAVGSVEVNVVRLNLALLALSRNDVADARTLLRDLLEPLRRSNRVVLLAVCEAALYASLARLKERRAAEHHLGLLERLLASTALADRDLADVLDSVLPELSGGLQDRTRQLSQVQRRRLGL